MKDQILKIAKAKNEADFYKKYPTEEAFMAKHGKTLKKAAMGSKMVKQQLTQLTDWTNPPQMYDGGPLDTSIIQTYNAPGMPNMSALNAKLSDPGFQQQATQNVANSAPTPSTSSFDAGAAGMNALGSAGQIISGIQAIGQQKKNIRKAEASAKVSDIVAQAADTRQIGVQKHRYVRPEDALLSGATPTGTGTSYLAANGAEIQNTYNPGNLYSDLGYEPLNDSNPKQFKKGGKLPKAEVGDYVSGDSGQAQIAGSVGSAVAAGFGLPPQLGELAGNVLGNLFGGAQDANRLARANSRRQENMQNVAMQQSLQGFQSQNRASMKDGGDLSDEQGWMNPDYNPQLITKFGDVDVTDIHNIAHDGMDSLRAGGHLKDYTPPTNEAMYTGRDRYDDGGLVHPDESYLAMGGDLKVYRGEAETISHNPFLPDGGETVMFRGPSHADGGMPISFGQNGVEVQGGEPAVKLEDGGSAGGSNLTVFGGMEVSKDVAKSVNLPKAAGKKYQTVAADLSKIEAKQNKINDKAADLAANSNENDPFSQLSLASAKANMIGANMKLKNIAEQKQDLGRWQNEILKHADENGLVADDLAKGKIKKAKFGGKFTAAFGEELNPVPRKTVPMFGQWMGLTDTPGQLTDPTQANPGLGSALNPGMYTPGQSITPIQPAAQPITKAITSQTSTGRGKKANVAPSSVYTPPTFVDLTVDPNNPTAHVWDTPQPLPIKAGTATTEAIVPAPDYTGQQSQKPNYWKMAGLTALSAASPFLKPTNQFPLDPSELSGEMLALASNQVEPVQAQSYQPRLKQAYNVSLQDQLNEVDQQSRAALRQIGNNPSAAATIAAQAAEAKNKIRGEQLRMNQAQTMGVANENVNTLNEAQLRNLAIYDKQYERQAEAKSKTKAQAIGALQSIAEKVARNKQENLMSAVEQQRYNYRFSPSGAAYSVNDPYFFNTRNVGTGINQAEAIPQGGGTGGYTPQNPARDPKGNPMLPKYNKKGEVTGWIEEAKSGAKVKARNGAIVKALKNL